MRLIVLAGLVSIEKIELAVALAQHFMQTGQSVTVIDNVRRLPLDNSQLDDVVAVRIDGALGAQLIPALSGLPDDVVILAASETISPDDLSLLLDDARQQIPGLDVQMLALIDTRTCDCFPQFRVSLEAYADRVVNLPAAINEVVEVLSC
ncbi:MAG TPA: hypothetical protein VKY59_15305 [Spirillospora sp.]|nr:hypothetical protein [Spirillospora sp.]